MPQKLSAFSWLCQCCHQLFPADLSLWDTNNDVSLKAGKIGHVPSTWLRFSTRFTISSSGQSKKSTMSGSAPICIMTTALYYTPSTSLEYTIINCKNVESVIFPPFDLSLIFFHIVLNKKICFDIGKKKLDGKIISVTYNLLECYPVILTPRETINEKFIIVTWFHFFLNKFDRQFWWNYFSFLNRVENHGADNRNPQINRHH